MLSVVVLGLFALYFTFSTNQTVNDSICDDNVIKNHTTTVTTATADFHPRVDSEDLFHLENIPAFMREYFAWHGRQLQQMKEDMKKSEVNLRGGEENYDYLSKYRFLIMRCAAGKNNGRNYFEDDRCGGLSDRLKPFPLFLFYAATTDRILFIRWGSNRPAPIEQFMIPGNFWNWTVPDMLMRKIEKLEGTVDVDINNDFNDNFTRLYYDGLEYEKMREKIVDQTVWMIEGNDYTGGRSRYEQLVNNKMKMASASTSDQPSSFSDTLSASKLRPQDANYEFFYHDLFHATFRPSSGVEELLSAYFYDPNSIKKIEYKNENEIENENPEDELLSTSRSWLPVPLQRNQYAVAHYRAQYPREPYRETQNRTILRETTIHAVECAKSRVNTASQLNRSQNTSSTASLNEGVSAVYVASDTALVVEAVRDTYHNHYDKPSEESANPMKSVNVWTYLDLQTYDTDNDSSNRDGGNMKTKFTVTLAEDPPHLNFAQRDELSAFYVVFVDLFLMSYASCVVYGAGGFGRMGSLLSYQPSCGMPYTVNHGILQPCSPYDPLGSLDD